MTLKDKLEIGLKPDANYRKDNLPENQVRGPLVDAGPGRSPIVPAAADDTNIVPDAEMVEEVEAEDAEAPPADE
jgi:hypothetical protein